METKIDDLRRVFIVGTHTLFEEGLSNLLAKNTAMQVSNEKYTNDLWLLNTISRNQPHVILLAESDNLNSAHLLGLLFSIPVPTSLWVIVVRLADSMVDVYKFSKQADNEVICKRQQFAVTSHSELVTLVEGDFGRFQAGNQSLSGSQLPAAI